MSRKIYYAMAQSDELEPGDAAMEVVESCLEQLGDRKASAGIIYMGIAVDHQAVLDTVCSRISGLKLIGCTTDGEFSSETGYMQDSVLLLLFSSDEIEFVAGRIDLSRLDVDDLRDELKRSTGSMNSLPRLGILFTDGISLNSENSIAIMNSVFENKVPFFGGAAADRWRFTGTRQFYNNTVTESTAVYLLLYGEFDYSFAIGTGWTAVGSCGVVNKVERNIVREINNMRAIDFYRDLLGKDASPSIEMPMAVYDENDSFLFLRTTLGNIISEDGSLVFLGDIQEGHKVRVTIVDRTSILDGTAEAADLALKRFPAGKKPSVALCFSCTARRAILGMRTDEECGLVKSRLGVNAIIAGFYTYGSFRLQGHLQHPYSTMKLLCAC